MKKILPFIMSLTLLAGCASSASSSDSVSESGTKSVAESQILSEATDDDTDDEEDLAYWLWDYEDKYDYCKEYYPDKTVLVWVTSASTRYEDKLNDYLYENGYDYVICFRYIGPQADETPLEQLEAIFDNNEEIDILSDVGRVTTKDAVSDSGKYMMRQGYFEPLDDLLAQEAYADYVATMPQKYWDNDKFDGHTYMIDTLDNMFNFDSGFEFSNEIVESLNLTADDFSSDLTECEDTFKRIYEQTGKKVLLNSVDFPENYGEIALPIAIVDGKAVNICEMQSVKDYLLGEWNLVQKGYATFDSDLTYSGTVNDENVITNGEPITNDASGTTTFITKQYDYVNATGMHGIYSGSEYKDMAFDALMNVLFNKDINNIASFGVEGENYTVFDDIVTMINGNLMSGELLNNPLVSYKYISDEVNTTFDYYALYENAEVKTSDFYFDASAVAEQYLKVEEAYLEFDASDSAFTNDPEQYLADFNQSLYDAGLQDILDEANRQLNEWRE